MHMADALLNPAIGGGFWAGSPGVLLYSAKRVKKDMNEKLIPLMGVLGAFVFAGQMINFTIPGTSSSGHLGRGLLLSILMGPHAALLVIASVLSVQSLFFADGGIMALGCSIWNIGFYPCFIAYPLVYRSFVKNAHSSVRLTFAAILGAVAALQLGAFSVVLQTRLSGVSELPFTSLLLFMQPIHLAIGLMEGFITAGVVTFMKKLQPDILETNRIRDKRISLKKIVVMFAVITLLLGGIISWFASSNPDALERSAERVLGRSELNESDGRIAARASQLQETTALLPDHAFQSGNENSGGISDQNRSRSGTSVSGIAGVVLVLLLISFASFGIRAFRRRRP